VISPATAAESAAPHIYILLAAIAAAAGDDRTSVRSNVAPPRTSIALPENSRHTTSDTVYG